MAQGSGCLVSPPEMWFVMREDHPESRTMLPELIPWPLIQGIALIHNCTWKIVW